MDRNIVRQMIKDPFLLSSVLNIARRLGLYIHSPYIENIVKLDSYPVLLAPLVYYDKTLADDINANVNFNFVRRLAIDMMPELLDDYNLMLSFKILKWI